MGDVGSIIIIILDILLSLSQPPPPPPITIVKTLEFGYWAYYDYNFNWKECLANNTRAQPLDDLDSSNDPLTINH